MTNTLVLKGATGEFRVPTVGLMTTERPLAQMSGYARLNLINEADDFKKNRLAKLGKANERTLKTIVKETNKH